MKAWLVVIGVMLVASKTPPVNVGRQIRPLCKAEAGRQAEEIRGSAVAGSGFTRTTPSGWIVKLVPRLHGWSLQVTTEGRETEDLARLTPPWHFVPNPREIDGWHFRNADNSGPNDGSVNAPHELREFIFSTAIGREIEYKGSATSVEDVDRVRAFGRGWLFIESYRLTPPQRGERAAFETIRFSACVTWPVRQIVD